MAPASINNQDRRALCARTARRADATPRAQFRRRRDRPSLAWHRHLADGTWAGSPCHSNILPLLRRRNGYRSVDRKSASSTSTSPPTAASHWFRASRSEEHTSELQSQSNLVCRLLLEKKKTHITELMTVNMYPFTTCPLLISENVATRLPTHSVVCSTILS